MISYLPGFIILVFCLIAALISAGFSNPETSAFKLKWIIWMLWIPVVEELLYRVYLGDLLRSKFGVYLGSYLSILLFGMVHVSAHWTRPDALWWAMPLGVLLLASCCEVIWHFTKQKGAIIFFHACANFSVVIFASIDRRWLDYLNFLYL